MNITLPATITGLRTLKDGTISINLSLQEITPEMAARAFQMQNQFVKAYITTEGVVSQEVKEMLNELEIESEDKSPSKRMRNVFYRFWEQDKQGYEDFELFYRWQMNKIIEHFKNKLI